MSIVRTCEIGYGLHGCTLRSLEGGVTDHTYALERAGADPLVLRVQRPGSGDLPTHEQVLLFLEESGYPAPRVIRAPDGSPAIHHDDWTLVLTSYINGEMVESGANTPEGLYAMGRAIGRLHSLSPLDSTLPRAEFMPESALGWAEERLATVTDRVPAEWRYRLDEVLRSLASTPSFLDAPICLIHNDCHPGNAVRRADGEVVLIDWDGAGLGAAMLDLGFLLIAADTYTPDVPTIGDSDTRVNAIVDGYFVYRRPNLVELEHLADAIRFRVTFINAMTFARHVESNELHHLPASWWDGCSVAEELATRVRRRFKERHAARVGDDRLH
jgi:Ser/Thr protein kinase RdoA (MazF antagonist)